MFNLPRNYVIPPAMKAAIDALGKVFRTREKQVPQLKRLKPTEISDFLVKLHNDAQIVVSRNLPLLKIFKGLGGFDLHFWQAPQPQSITSPTAATTFFYEVQSRLQNTIHAALTQGGLAVYQAPEAE